MTVLTRNMSSGFLWKFYKVWEKLLQLHDGTTPVGSDIIQIEDFKIVHCPDNWTKKVIGK